MGTKASLAAGLAATALLVAAGLPAAQAAEETSIGQRYHDRLDSRWSSISLARTTRALGYTSHGHSGGRDVDNAFLDGINASVFGLFGHGNKGIFQTAEGATDLEDHIFAAGTATDVVSPWRNLRFFTEYVPYAEVDDMRLLIVAACYTAGTSDFGNFMTAGASRGIDSVVTFQRLVYFPSTAPGTAVTDTNYSGNYFWHRFSYHVEQGTTVSTALARARTDLVAKEGSSGGWHSYVLGGALDHPGGVRLKPAGEGTGGNSDPLATVPFATFSDLTTVSTTIGEGPGGMPTTDVATEEGVSYRLGPDGAPLDAAGVATTSGSIRYTTQQATDLAEEFVRRNVSGFSDSWHLVDVERTAHSGGEELIALRWRSDAAGYPGSRMTSVEIDRRTGAVVYFSDTRGAAETAQFAVTRDEAIAIAQAELGTAGAATAVADVWHRSRWIVTVDRGLMGRPGAEVPDVKQVAIDAATGGVLAVATA